jgi:uncharacterized membrane protein (DUF4010 family)
MFQYFQNSIPPDSIKFLLVLLFSLLIGLEQRKHHIDKEIESLFGTDRTFTLIGVLGFILYVIDPKTMIPFLGGGLMIGILLGLYYLEKMRIQMKFGLTSIVIALITYCLTPLIYTQPDWLVLIIVVSILVLTEIKQSLFDFTKKFDTNEFTTLAKFLIIAGIILPILPDSIINPIIAISPFKFWLAIVAVSGISYFSYLLKKFIFPKSGIILTGILGGLYSSTATTVILAKKSKETPSDKRITVAILLATSMMYLRIFLLALFFNKALAFSLAAPFAILLIASALLAFYFYKFKKTPTPKNTQPQDISLQNNPLEFNTALLFGFLFIVFALLTEFVNKTYGSSGINVLSFLVGVTDIDPFIINLLQSKMNMANSFLVIAIVNATTSNNLLKMIYGISLGDKSFRKPLIIGFSILIAVGLFLSFLIL